MQKTITEYTIKFFSLDILEKVREVEHTKNLLVNIKSLLATRFDLQVESEGGNERTTFITGRICHSTSGGTV